MKSPTYKLLRVIGSPYVNGDEEFEKTDKISMYEYAKKNKMPLLYLRSIVESDVYDAYHEDFVRLDEQWLDIEERIKKVLEILDGDGIKYTTFKSIKPYKEVTVDIDLLILDSYELTVKKLQESGYHLLEKGPLSSTFRDTEVEIDYDIYDEVGVSYIVYFDKDRVHENIVDMSLESGGVIKSLSPELDLLAVIAHSVIKEQLYTLAEYYTTLYYLQRMRPVAVESFIRFVDGLKLRSAVKAHLGITYLLHRIVHGWIPEPLGEVVRRVGVSDLEYHRLLRSNLKMPHKFHSITLIKAFTEKLGDPKTRRSYSRQLRNMMNPRFLTSFIPQFLSHVVRETY